MMFSADNLRLRRFVRLLLFLVAWPAGQTHAQPKPSTGPSSTHIFPAGGRRGTIVPVAVGGECLPPGTRFDLVGEKVTALQTTLLQRVAGEGEPAPRRYPTEIPINYPKQWTSSIAIADDAPLGPVYWRLSCGQGGTCSRPFMVGELPEFIEQESNSIFELAEPIELPLTINGQICGERDVDHYRFAAREGDIVSCEVVARRIGSPLDANLAILNADGEEIATEQRFIGSDILIAAAIRKTGDYVLRIANVSFRGDPAHVYRVNVSKQPLVFACYPAGGPVGSERRLTFLAMSGTDTPVEVARKVRFPHSDDERFTYRCGWFANAVTLGLDHDMSLLEAEPNQSFADAEALTVPCTVDGCLTSEHDVDWFAFEAARGERLSLVCQISPFLTSALPCLVLFDGDGNELAQSATTASHEDRRIEWQAAESGTYRVRVRDLRFGSQGGPDFVYRLVIRPATPDFRLRLEQDCVNLTVGDKLEIPVSAQRFGGFAGDVVLAVEGLPAGITAEETTIEGSKSNGQLTLKASANVGLGDVGVRVVGRAQIDGEQAERVAAAQHYGVDSEGVSIGPPTRDRLTLALTCQPPFRLSCSEAYQYAHRGSVFMYPMEIERLHGFTGAVTLQIGDRQNRDLDGIEMFEVTIPADQTDIQLPIYLPETMHINVQSQSQLYAQGYATLEDELDQEHAVLVLAEKRNMLRTLPPVVKLQAMDERVAIPPGGEVVIRFRLERTKNFDGPMSIELRDPDSPAITAGSTTIAAGDSTGEMIVRVGPDWQTTDHTSFRFRATGVMADATQLITETTVELAR